MNRKYFLGASVLCSSLLITGCVSTTPRLDSQFAESVNLLKVQQICPTDTTCNNISEMNGKEAVGAYREYLSTYNGR